jgi:hypothetical protein
LTTYDSDAYEITPTTTYSFDNETMIDPESASDYFSTVIDGPVITCDTFSTGTSCVGDGPGAAQPAENPGALNSFLLSTERCIFFNGGTLGSDAPDTKSVHVTVSAAGPNRGRWHYTWTYTITPVNTVEHPSTVGPLTSWDVDASGSLTVDVGFNGFVSSESFLQSSKTNKYSFTLLENGLTRVRGVTGQLESSPDGVDGWTAVGSPADLNNADTDGDSVNDALDVSSTGADYSYFGNGGVFGKSTVFGALHALGRKAANFVVGILNGTPSTLITDVEYTYKDNFAGNNNDLAAGNVHEADYSGTWLGVPGDPNGGTLYYRTVISGTIKGNASIGSEPFSVASIPVVIGGCQ